MAQPFRSKTGIYQLRRKVPEDLRPALGHEYKRSLKTREPAEAKRLFAEEWARSESAFALARAQLQGVAVLGERDMQVLAARWLRTCQDAMECRRQQPAPATKYAKPVILKRVTGFLLCAASWL